MTLYRNSHPMRLDFPSLQNPDGTGVSLEAGATIDLDVEPVDVTHHHADGSQLTFRHHPGCVWLVPADTDDDDEPEPEPDLSSIPPHPFAAPADLPAEK